MREGKGEEGEWREMRLRKGVGKKGTNVVMGGTFAHGCHCVIFAGFNAFCLIRQLWLLIFSGFCAFVCSFAFATHRINRIAFNSLIIDPVFYR